MQALQKYVGSRIREIREQKGLSQEALADICNLHRTYIGLIERGERNLSIGTVEQIAAGLGVAASEFFAGSQSHMPLAASASPAPKMSTPDLMTHIATIQQILIEANLTDANRYEALYVANRSKPTGQLRKRRVGKR